MLLPGWLSLDSLSIIRLAALLLSFLITVYLVLVPKKSHATLFLAGVFAGAFVFNISQLFESAGPLYWQPRTPKTVLVHLLDGIGPSVAMIFLLLFAYHYPRFRQVEKKEFDVVLGLSIALNAGVLGLNVYNHFVLQWRFSDMRLWNIYWLVFYCSLGTQFVGAIVLLFRKAARLSGHGHRSFLARLIRPSTTTPGLRAPSGRSFFFLSWRSALLSPRPTAPCPFRWGATSRGSAFSCSTSDSSSRT